MLPFFPMLTAEPKTCSSLIKALFSVISFHKNCDGNLNLQNPNKVFALISSYEIKNSFPFEALYSITAISGLSIFRFLFRCNLCPTSRHLMQLHVMLLFFSSFSMYCLRFVLSTPASVAYVGMSLWTRIILQYFGTNCLNHAINSAASFVFNGLKFPFM